MITVCWMRGVLIGEWHTDSKGVCTYHSYGKIVDATDAQLIERLLS